MMMTPPARTRRLQWYAARLKPLRNPGRTTCRIGCEAETYRAADGTQRRRPVKDTGRRVFVHEHLLRRAGFEVFLPVRKEWRRVSPHRPDKELRAYPLLTGWLFVGWSEDVIRFADLADLDIVTAILGRSGQPMRVPEARVISLMRRFGGGYMAPGLQRYMRTGAEFDRGDVVRIDRPGPLDGCDLKVVDIDGPVTHGVMQMLGRMVEVTQPTADLVPVGEHG